MKKESIQEKRNRLINNLFVNFYKKNNYNLNIETASFYKETSVVSWGIRSKFEDFINFQPIFTVYEKSITKILEKIFPTKSGRISIRAQGIQFARELNVFDFDKREFAVVLENDYDFSTYKYKIFLDTDLIPIIKDHIEFMEKVTLPYFEKLSTVKGISNYFNNRLLNLPGTDFKNEKTQDSFQKEEVLSSIIASYLEKEERLNKVIETYKKLYTDNDWYLNDINILDNWIKENRVKA